jgi:hypothetical protein
MATIKEIKQSFETELLAIFSLDQSLAEERSAIKRLAFAQGRALTATEVQRLKQIAATRGELAEAIEDLGLDTVNALESVSDIDLLLSKIGIINQQLKDDLDHLKTIEDKAAKAQVVANGLLEIVDKLKSLKMSLA